jgi:hypothetical protein
VEAQLPGIVAFAQRLCDLKRKRTCGIYLAVQTPYYFAKGFSNAA